MKITGIREQQYEKGTQKIKVTAKLQNQTATAAESESESETATETGQISETQRLRHKMK